MRFARGLKRRPKGNDNEAVKVEVVKIHELL